KRGRDGDRAVLHAPRVRTALIRYRPSPRKTPRARRAHTRPDVPTATSAWARGGLGREIALDGAATSGHSVPTPIGEAPAHDRRPFRSGFAVSPSLFPCGQTGEAPRHDLLCLLHQLANDLTGRLDLPDQANALPR